MFFLSFLYLFFLFLPSVYYLRTYYYSATMLQNFNWCLLEHFLYNSFLNFIFHFHFNSLESFSHSRNIYFKFSLFFYSYKFVINFTVIINFKLKFTILILTSTISLNSFVEVIAFITCLIFYFCCYFYPELSLVFKTLLFWFYFLHAGFTICF
jgi:hypothetical protein